jgi:threonine/homoserine/homoserine lactone efflux protein
LNETIAFVIAAAALLGSPGPGITALVAVGRSFRPDAALRFYAAMQVGLAIAAGVSAIGLAGVIQSSPIVEKGLMAVGTAYLLWLAWTMASAPLGQGAIGDRETASLSAKGAFLLGIANPKAYLAFASLFGSFSLLSARGPMADGAMKWALCVLVMVVVDLAWLALGMLFGRLTMPPLAERAFNLVMGLLIVGACVATWVAPT